MILLRFLQLLGFLLLKGKGKGKGKGMKKVKKDESGGHVTLHILIQIYFLFFYFILSWFSQKKELFYFLIFWEPSDANRGELTVEMNAPDPRVVNKWGGTCGSMGLWVGPRAGNSVCPHTPTLSIAPLYHTAALIIHATQKSFSVQLKV